MYSRCRPSLEIFVELITIDDKIFLLQLSVYIHKAFSIRTENIYMIQ